MIRLTSDDLRRLADAIDNREKYDNMCGVVYLSIKTHPNGQQFAEFEQPCHYAECNSYFYRFENENERYRENRTPGADQGNESPP